jgi:putative tricarboxylic transport membrane protein
MPWSQCDWRPHRRTVLSFALAAGFAASAQLAPATAAGAGDFLKGQTVRFFVGYSPGGGYDAYARMLAPYFEKKTGATVVVENRPGGGGLTALNQLVREKPDGLTMMMLNGEASIMGELTKRPGVAYKMADITNLGRVAKEGHFLLVNAAKEPSDLKDIIKAGKLVKFSSTSRPDNLSDYAAVLCETFKLKCKIITGYKGSKEAGLALLNGEVDALTISDGSGNKIAQSDKAKVIATLGHERSEFRPNLPTIYEQFKFTPDQSWLMDFRLAIADYGRAVVAPPGVPADRLKYLQQVWKEILTDPAVIATAKKQQRPLDYAAPAVEDKTSRELLQSMPADRRKEIDEVILHKYS